MSKPKPTKDKGSSSSSSSSSSYFHSFIPFWKVYLIVLLTLTFFYCISDILNLYVLNCACFIVQFIGVSIVLLHLSWITARLIRKYISQRSYVSPANKCVLITGCDSGFGNRLARRLDAYGFVVYAGCLLPDSSSAQELKSSCSKNLRVVKLDVTKQEEVDSVVQQIKESGLELWSLVNNAGVSEYSMIEWGKGVNNFEKIFAVNLFGAVRVTKMCLPLLRKSKGRVVNMASTAGRFSFTCLTSYCMTKFALRSFSDGLRREMTHFGVKVITIEPNLYRTAIADGEILCKSIDCIWNETEDEVKCAYGGDQFKEKFKSRLVASVKVARPQIHEVIDAQEEACTIADPDIYYRCAGPGEKPALWLLESVSDLAKDYVLTGTTWKKCLEFFSTK